MNRQLIFLLFLFTSTSSIELTSEQTESMDNLAWLYAQFSLTFDKNELPLIDYFKTNRKDFNNFKEVLDFFNDANLQRHFEGVNMNEFAIEFEDQYKTYQEVIINLDQKPLPFRGFYILFEKLFKTQQTFHGPRVESYRSYWNKFVNNESTMKQFCSDVDISTNEQIKEALSNFNIQEPFPETYNLKKLKGNEKKYHTLSTEYKLNLEGTSDDKPTKWTYHHIIPSNVIVEFYQNYEDLVKFKSEKSTKQFNWFKIMEFNTQKTFLVTAATLYNNFKPTATLPVNEERPGVSRIESTIVNQQIDFVRAWYRWPRGLMFYGPQSNIRSDDPSSQQPSEPILKGFEEKAKHIIGQKYYDKVEQLHRKLVAFNEKYKKETTSDEHKEKISTEAMKLYKTLGTIYKEYNNGQPIIVFPFNREQWDYEINKWYIKTNPSVYDVVLNKWEWREKALAQEEDNRLRSNFDFMSMNLAILGVLSSIEKYHYDHDELKRRKRHHYIEPLAYVDELLETCEKSKVKIENTNSCDYYLMNGSSSILAVPVYGWCKLFG
jgi:hypothetical protein